MSSNNGASEAAGVAPGAPGLSPQWTSSAKHGAGTATNANSRVWFTVSHGIVDEVYHPFIDTANTRDMGLIIPARSFFSPKRNAIQPTK